MSLIELMKNSLLKEGRLRRYLLYAIGEILLIMIGVLLAFQVSKWNEKRTIKQYVYNALCLLTIK